MSDCIQIQIKLSISTVFLRQQESGETIQFTVNNFDNSLIYNHQ